MPPKKKTKSKAPPKKTKTKKDGRTRHGKKREETNEYGEATFLTHLVAGFCGGALSRTVTSPLNVVQVRKMTNKLTSQCKLIPSMVKIAKNEGVKALFAGNATMVLRFGPSKGLNFATFHFFNSNLHALVEKRREKIKTLEEASTKTRTSRGTRSNKSKSTEVEKTKKKCFMKK